MEMRMVEESVGGEDSGREGWRQGWWKRRIERG